MPFYSDMAAMAADLLKPDAAGGLGQGAITIVRITPGAPNLAAPWEPVTPTRQTATVNQISTIKAEYVKEGTIIVTDFAYMTTVPTTFDPRPGDTVEAGGATVGTIVHADPFPAHGTRVYWSIYVNR